MHVAHANAPVGENNPLFSDPRLRIHLRPTKEASMAPELGLCAFNVLALFRQTRWSTGVDGP
jgi:hypothetical protein